MEKLVKWILAELARGIAQQTLKAELEMLGKILAGMPSYNHDGIIDALCAEVDNAE